MDDDSMATVPPAEGVVVRTEAVPDYEIERLLARGGMGEVYLARDTRLRRPVALKTLREDCRGLEGRFLKEAQIAAQLQHPGIPPVYEVGTLPDGRPFFAMKLVQGRTLAELLAERPLGGHELSRLLGTFEQIAQAVGYAHSRGVIHRDLKPANVMVGAFGEVQVMDWGLAKVIGSADDLVETDCDEPETQAGAAIGTWAYMPPEQARGEAADEKSDVFGLGAVLCEVLTGQPAYSGEGLRERAAAGDVAEAYGRLDGCGADAELVALCRECLAKEAGGRPRHAGEVADRVRAHRAAVEERLRQRQRDWAAAQARQEEARARAEAERQADRERKKAREADQWSEIARKQWGEGAVYWKRLRVIAAWIGIGIGVVFATVMFFRFGGENAERMKKDREDGERKIAREAEERDAEDRALGRRLELFIQGLGQIIQRPNGRRQALALSLQHLEDVYPESKKDEPRIKAIKLMHLHELQTNPRLSRVRDEERLKELPEDEREGWRQFWREVARILQSPP